MRTITLEPITVTRESFLPYGVLPPDEGDGHPTADLEFLLHDGWVNYIGHTLDVVINTVGPFVYNSRRTINLCGELTVDLEELAAHRIHV